MFFLLRVYSSSSTLRFHHLPHVIFPSSKFFLPSSSFIIRLSFPSFISFVWLPIKLAKTTRCLVEAQARSIDCTIVATHCWFLQHNTASSTFTGLLVGFFPQFILQVTCEKSGTFALAGSLQSIAVGAWMKRWWRCGGRNANESWIHFTSSWHYVCASSGKRRIWVTFWVDFAAGGGTSFF